MRISARSSWPTLLMLGAPLLLAWAWMHWSGYQGLNGQDAHDYLRIAKAWAAWGQGGTRPVMAEHPHGYPMLGAAIGKVFGSELWGLRILSAAGLVLLLVVFHNLLYRAFPEARWIGPFLLLGFAVAPFLLRYALVVMSDVPAIALLALSFHATVRWIAQHRAMWLLVAVCAAALAVCMRLAAVPMVLLLAVAWVQGGSEGRVVRWRIAIAALAVGGLVLWWALPLQRIQAAIAGSPLAEWSLLNLFRREQVSDDGVLRYAVPNIAYVLGVAVHPGFLPMGPLLLPFLRRRDLYPAHARLALVLLAGYLLFIAGMPFQNDRVLLMAQPFALVLLFPTFERAMDFLLAKGIRAGWVVMVLALVQSGLFVRAILPFMHQAQVERELADRIADLRAPRIYTHGMGAALHTWCPGTPVTELWYKEIDRFEAGAIILVRPANLTAQWTGLPPAVNWQRAQAQGVETLAHHPDGWVICRVR
ncbi:MAG: glycosyltransferase family 39 protein [Flavobacteriales bacterium]|nr:glycosyltransferase family 39 protein [Flavobacteriales bacterium]